MTQKERSPHRRSLPIALAFALLPLTVHATTLGDYLKDGWALKGLANSTNAQILLQKADRALLCTLDVERRLDCVEISRWHVNDPK